MNLLKYLASLLGGLNGYKAFPYEKNTYGIVMPVPGKFFHHAYFLCQSLRKMHCKLPIQIWQAGDELSDEQVAMFNDIPDLVIHDIMDYIPGKDEQFFRGFQMKPLSLICSSFQHVLTMDADLVYLKNPESLFTSEIYEKNGCLFWHDRFKPIHNPRYINNSRAVHLWYHLKIKHPSERLKHSNFWNGRSRNYQESGSVYIDKSRFPETLRNLYQLNIDYEFTYQFMHGDKETYWVAMEMTNRKENTCFIDEQRAHFGGVKGHLLHCDLDGDPFWFQHGLGKGKAVYPVVKPQVTWVLEDDIRFGMMESYRDLPTDDLKFKDEMLSGELLYTYEWLKDDWIALTTRLGLN